MDYYKILKPLLFKLSPEFAHDFTMWGLNVSKTIGLLDILFAGNAINSSPYRAFGLDFPNRLGVAAGLDKDGRYVDALGKLGFGFIEVGTFTPEPQKGNPKPRMFRVVESEAIVNRHGFGNPGIDFAIKKLSKRKYKGVLGINIGKNKATPNDSATEDYLKGFRKARSIADYIAVNISSPNTEGLRNLQKGDFFSNLLETLLHERSLKQNEVPIVVKLSPDLSLSEIDELVDVLNSTSINGVIASNTTTDFSGISVKDGVSGGLSGSPLKPAASNLTDKLASRLNADKTLIGVGGIMSGKDAVDRLSMGASLVQVYTGLIFKGPDLISEILKEIGDLQSSHSPARKQNVKLLSSASA